MPTHALHKAYSLMIPSPRAREDRAFRVRKCWRALVRRLSSWWPDLYASILALLGASAVLVNEAGAERFAIGKLFPGATGVAYLALVIAAALGLILAVLFRRAIQASWAASALAILLALNGGCVTIAFGTDSIFAACGYVIAAMLLLNRSYVLARGVVVPSWRAEL